MESARGMIEVMQQAGLEPNCDTYTALMCGYAKTGNIEEIITIIKVRCLLTGTESVRSNDF